MTRPTVAQAIAWQPESLVRLAQEWDAAAGRLQAQADTAPAVAVTESAAGPGTIETYSVRYDWDTRTGIIIGRLDADGTRFLATTEDEDLVALLSDDDPLGVDAFATHRLPLAAAPHAYESFQKKEDGMVKVLLKP